MDYINAIKTAYNVGEQVISDYQRGRKARLLGKYPDSNSIKKLGHYNNSRKDLGVYRR